MKNFLPTIILVVIANFYAGSATATSQCEKNIEVPLTNANTLQVDGARITRRLDPSFFGFNLEWLEFQSSLWDKNNQRVLPSVVSIFKYFPGAVYRFPGGTNSNNLNWQDAVGPLDKRQLHKYVSWLGPLRSEFGIDEYLKFVKDVNGQAWYVANLYGSFDAVTPPRELADNAGRLATYMSQRAKMGMPTVLRWELGNELDRSTLKWSPSRVANSALPVGSAIRKSNMAAKFVVFQQEYPAQAEKGYSSARYNKEIRSTLADLQPELAMHFYYDGPPDAPPVDYFLRQLCQVVDNAKAEGSQGRVWITEHGRVPNKFWATTPKELWPETANLTAAISMADMLIALTHIPEVSGAFAHALVATSSPWPLVHKRSDGTVDPSVTLLGMKLLRQSMLPNVLASSQTTSNSGSQGATYAVRSTVLTNDDHTAFSVWAVNKSNKTQQLQFQIKNVLPSIIFNKAISISDEQFNANNYMSPTRVQLQSKSATVAPNGTGTWSIQLQPNSVNTISFIANR